MVTKLRLTWYINKKLCVPIEVVKSCSGMEIIFNKRALVFAVGFSRTECYNTSIFLRIVRKQYKSENFRRSSFPFAQKEDEESQLCFQRFTAFAAHNIYLSIVNNFHAGTLLK